MQIFTVLTTLLTIGAAVVALFYARETVVQAREGQREAHRWRQDDLEERSLAQADSQAAHAEHIAELRSLRDQAAAAHQVQMRERAQALASEKRLQRLNSLDRVADAIVDLASTAWDEALNPPGPRPLAMPPTRLHLKRARLQTCYGAYRGLGGAEMANVGTLLTQLDSHIGGEPTEKYVGLAVSALRAVEYQIGSDQTWPEA